MPPMVMRICFRCWPYTGRTMMRSKARPSAPAAAMATSMAVNTATRLRQTESLALQSAMPPITLVATKAPSAMNTPWPKFSTSIRPKIKVRPEAMMKMISPIASPATLSVTQVDGEPTSGNASSSTAPSNASGFQSNWAFGTAAAGGEAAAAARCARVH